MELDEMIALMAAPIYAVLLANMMAAKRELSDESIMPSADWKFTAMRLAVVEAELLWDRVIHKEDTQ